MRMRKALKELLSYIAAGLTVWLCILIISSGSNVLNAITKAIERCLNVIIPSLFSFMAISGIIINTKIYKYISKPFYPITKYILKMPNNLFFVFLLGNISGYPIGAKLLLQLLKENIIDKKTAEIMSCFCYGGGPAFFIGVIGLTVYNNANIGILIFLSVAIANFIIAAVMCRIFKPKCIETKEKIVFNSDIIIQAVLSTGKALFIICITILFFSVLMSLLDSEGVFNLLKNIGLSENICTIIKSIFEISNVSYITSNSTRYIPLIAGICSFGGICVLMQIKSIIGNEYSLKPFLISRIIGAGLSIIICQVIIKFFYNEFIAAVSEKTAITFAPNNFVPSICLISMIFIISIREKSFLNRKKLSSHNIKTAND